MRIFCVIALLTVLPLSGIKAQFAEEESAVSMGVVAVKDGKLSAEVISGGIRAFKGIPYAAAPVGELRWQAPQPAIPWKHVRSATKFGPRAMQQPIFGDMNFRSNGVSEDCLYLNVWTAAKSPQERRPVLVYFYGGGFMAGDGSEPRYDGESMARQGIVAVTVNYRLGVFGFLAHPELTKESPNHASGNYGLLDQAAALKWVKTNIAAFGGDPQHVTIGGESAGSFSVSAQMVSPLAKDLMVGAIGESGSLLGLQPLPTLAQAEQTGTAFAASVGASSLAALRALPAQQLLEAAGKPGAPRFSAIVDGYFLPRSPAEIYAASQQAKVPLLVGWNSQEMGHQALLGQAPPTADNFRAAVQKLYANRLAEVLRLYPAATDAEAEQSATDLASDRFIGYSTWKWADVQTQTGGKPVYRYLYARPRPAMTPGMGNATTGLAGGVVKGDAAAPPAPPARGAVHSAEIEYALGNLAANKVFAWTADDYQVSKTMQAYFANFIKTGNPNGAGLPAWPAATAGAGGQVLRLDVQTRVEPDQTRPRYLFLEQK
ncbi:carboxylesterase/lipase family protein [Hymenobacter convexus]|uniref:carboxylesterase/lipase family protein n=1 Tax=Hymenobacter sp. CA1UV-4 TaxID=3063782 RepID=UPI002712771A|nr:carboxylesterase family protein [Hymenobacter sp. CA1UV-4]MDO7850916.1 carboxylesterase family protein [Hymenobacter sp. CA1UV-4]